MADIPNLCLYIEKEFDIASKESQDFDDHVLTREGLASTPGLFDDFVEPGDFWPFLEDRSQRNGASSLRGPAFGIDSGRLWDAMQELGARPANSVGNLQDPILKDYPLLSRLNDISMGAYYEPQEIPSLIAEVVRAQSKVKQSPSLRALDDFYRIARWAERDRTGIFFPGQ